MITLTDSIEIKATPEKVFEWVIQRFQSKETIKLGIRNMWTFAGLKANLYKKAPLFMPKNVFMDSCIN